MVCHYQFFLDKAYRYEPEICNSCYDVLMVAFWIRKYRITGCKRYCLQTYYMEYE